LKQETIRRRNLTSVPSVRQWEENGLRGEERADKIEGRAAFSRKALSDFEGGLVNGINLKPKWGARDISNAGCTAHAERSTRSIKEEDGLQQIDA